MQLATQVIVLAVVSSDNAFPPGGCSQQIAVEILAAVAILVVVVLRRVKVDQTVTSGRCREGVTRQRLALKLKDVVRILLNLVPRSAARARLRRPIASVRV